MFTRISRMTYYPHDFLTPSTDHWISVLVGLSVLARWMLPRGKIARTEVEPTGVDDLEQRNARTLNRADPPEIIKDARLFPFHPHPRPRLSLIFISQQSRRLLPSNPWRFFEREHPVIVVYIACELTCFSAACSCLVFPS